MFQGCFLENTFEISKLVIFPIVVLKYAIIMAEAIYRRNSIFSFILLGSKRPSCQGDMVAVSRKLRVRIL